jgi:hypothetical protein
MIFYENTSDRVLGPDSRAGRRALVHGRVVGAGNPAFFRALIATLETEQMNVDKECRRQSGRVCP